MVCKQKIRPFWQKRLAGALVVVCVAPALYVRGCKIAADVRTWCACHVIAQKVVIVCNPGLRPERKDALYTYLTDALCNACLPDVDLTVFVQLLQARFSEVISCTWFLSADRVLEVQLEVARPVAVVNQSQVLAHTGKLYQISFFDPALCASLIQLTVDSTLLDSDGCARLCAWALSLDSVVCNQFTAQYYNNSNIKLFSKDTQKYCLVLGQRTMVDQALLSRLEQIVQDLVARKLIKLSELRKPRVRLIFDLRFDERVIVSCEGTKAWGVGYERRNA